MEQESSFIEFVRCQPCCMAAINSGVFLPTSVNRTRQSDPHHLRSFTNNTRRYCDWFIVPLSRGNHSWLHTVEGVLWEKENMYNLYRYTGHLLVEYKLYEENPFLSVDSLREDCYNVLKEYENVINS